MAPARDIQTQAQLILDMKKRLAEITAAQTGKTVEQVNADGDRDRWFNAQEALEYGFVDHIRESATDVVGGGGTEQAALRDEQEHYGNPKLHQRWRRRCPNSRYILPTFEERTAYGYKRQDPYAKLFEDRIIFLGVQVDDASADDVMAQLLVLESQDPDRDIVMYINSPGGSFTAMTAIYDTMQYIRPQIQTVVSRPGGVRCGGAARCGQPGQATRPAERPHPHPPARRWAKPVAARRQTSRSRRPRCCACAPGWRRRSRGHSNRTPEQVNNDIERDKILSAAEALEYGLIDQVLTSRKNAADARQVGFR